MNSVLSCTDLHKVFHQGKVEVPVLFGINLDVSADKKGARQCKFASG